MKKLSEIINVECIKCENKIGNDAITALHREANKLLFKYSKRYINTTIRQKLLEEFTRIGKELSELSPTPKAQPKQKELIGILRDIYKSLKAYTPSLDKYSYCGSQTLRFVLSTYLHYKDKGIDPTTALALLNNIKETREEWKNVTPPPALVKANNELIGYLSEYYSIV